MYFPPKFDRTRAVELFKLVEQAYKQFEAFKASAPWKLQGDYNTIATVYYHTVLSFDATQPEDTTVIDQEVQGDQVSFGLLDTLAGKDIPMGFLLTQGTTAYLVLRGTVTPREWLFDATIGMSPYRQPGWGLVSTGFMKIYDRCRDSFIQKLASLSPACDQLFITGHSLGGALTLLALPDVIKSTPFKAPLVYNIGCPRVGDKDFASAYNALPKTTTYRVVNSCDLVPSMPLPVVVPLIPSGDYTHVGIPVEFTFQGGSLGLNHTTSTYISALS